MRLEENIMSYLVETYSEPLHYVQDVIWVGQERLPYKQSDGRCCVDP